MPTTSTPDRVALPPLRVGILLGARRLPRWILALLDEIDDANFADLDVVALLRSEDPPVAGVGLPLRLLDAVDARALAPRRDACEMAELRPAAAHDPLPEFSTTADAMRELSKRRLDVVLVLGADGEGLAGCATHGAWSVVFGDLDGYRGEPPYVWELHDRARVSGTVLRADCDDASHVLYRSYSPTDAVSVRRNRSTAAWKVVRATLLRLRELQLLGRESLLAHAGQLSADAADKSVRSVRARDVGRVGVAMGRTGLRRWLEARSQRGEWFVAYRERHGWPPWDSAAPYHLLDAPPGRFFADPFLFERDGRHFLFVEDFDDSMRRAAISVIELLSDGSPTRADVVLERDYHLSYPFVFEHEGDVYMVPESSASRCVELYRADRFPHEWSLERVLLEDMQVDDATLLRHDGRFWLFASIAADGTRPVDGELFLFSSASLSAEWVPHPWNPVVADARSARPAGRVFSERGMLIRPAQDCSVRYGYATVFNRIDALSETEYREVPLARLGPEWADGNLGTHTYSRDSVYEAVDGLRQHLRFGKRRVHPSV